MCQRSIDLYVASQATEVVTRVVRKVVSKVVRRLITKVISTCTSLRTTLLTRRLMTFDHGSCWFCREELATPPPAVGGEIAGEAASDPSLPTTGWRGRRQPPNLVQLAGAGWPEGTRFRKRAAVGQELRWGWKGSERIVEE